MMDFKPSEDYNELKKQAISLHRLYLSAKECERHYREKLHDHSDEYVQSLLEQIESERQMNHVLTTEIEEWGYDCYRVLGMKGVLMNFK